MYPENSKSLSRLVRSPEVVSLTGYTIASIYRKMAEGSFPRPLKLGARAVAWREEDIIAWQTSLEVAS